MSQKLFEPSPGFSENAHVDKLKYNEMYAASIADPDAFWGEHGKRIDWIKPYSKVKDVSYEPGNIELSGTKMAL